MAHGAAGNAPFDVVLGEGVEGAVDDVDDPENENCKSSSVELIISCA